MSLTGPMAARKLRAELEAVHDAAVREAPLRAFPVSSRSDVTPLPAGAPAREEDVVVTMSRGATGMITLAAPAPAPAPALPTPPAVGGAPTSGRFQHPARRVSSARPATGAPAAAAVLPFDPARNATLQRLVAEVEAATLAAAPRISRAHPTRNPVAPSHIRYLEALEDEVAALRIVARERHAVVMAKLHALQHPDWRPTHKVALETFMQASATPAGVLHPDGRHVYAGALGAGVIDPEGRGPTGRTRSARPPPHPTTPLRVAASR